MHPITPSLWFQGQAEAAARFYVSVFPRSGIDRVVRYGPHSAFGPGTALSVHFHLNGQPFVAFNGDGAFRFSPAVSWVIPCRDQAELDHYWQALVAEGEGEPGGWVRDRFGISWQIQPDRLPDWLAEGGEAAERVMRALSAMRCPVWSELERAHQGAEAASESSL